jgi:hypothetical protein
LDEYLTLVGTLLGAVLGGIIGFVGAYLVEEQHFKKERITEMRDKIYGPMFMITSRTLEAIESFGRSGYKGPDSMKELKDNYLFFTIREDLKRRWSEIIDRLDKYQTVRFAAELALDEATKRASEVRYRVNIGGNSGADYDFLRLLVGKTMASSLDLRTAVFLKLAPQDFLIDGKEKWGENIRVDVNITGAQTEKNTLDEFEWLYTSMLTMMEKEPLYLTEKEQRERLIKELKSFLEQIEPFVKHKRSPFVLTRIALTRFANVVQT